MLRLSDPVQRTARQRRQRGRNLLPRLLGCAACLLSAVVTRPATDPGARQFMIAHLRSEDGLPENHVSTILQTSDGYLWVGTWFGFARFDGLKFTVFDKHSNPEMVDDTIVGFAEDNQDHSLWIGTAEGGLYQQKNGRLVRYDLRSDLGSSTLQYLGADHQGGVWAGNLARFGHFRGGRMICTAEADAPILWIRDLANGRLRLATTHGLREFDVRTREFGDRTPPGSPVLDWTACCEGRQPGELYVGHEGQTYWLVNGKWSATDGRNGLPGDLVQQLYADRSGGVWIGTGARDLHRLDHGKLLELSLGQPDFVPPHVTCILEDLEGNLWVGTDDGLFRLHQRQLFNYTMRDGLLNNQVWSVCEDRDGAIWAGTGRGVNRLKDGVFTTVSPPYRYVEGAVQSQVRSVLVDRSGDLWIGTMDGPLQLHAGTWIRRAPRNRDFPYEVSCLYEDRSNVVWVATARGVGRYGPRATQWFGPANFPGLDVVCSMLEDRTGTFWLGADKGGLIRYQQGKFTLFTAKDGLAGNEAWALFEDSSGVLWIGGETGLTRYEAGRFSAIRTEQGLEENTINCILEDDAGHLWLSGLHGIYRIAKSELKAVADGLGRQVHCVAFREADGMESSETNGENQPAGWKGRDGRLWFPTDKGLVVIDPTAVLNREVAPPVVIETITANDQVVYSNARRRNAPAALLRRGAAGPDRTFPGGDLRTPVQLPPEFRRVLKIQFTANSFVDPKNVRLKYRLDGHDTDWQDDDGGRSAVYTNLQPGRYKFHVIAGNNHGYWNPTGASFEFRLAPYFHETIPFYALCGVTVILLGGGVQAYRLRVQRKILLLEQRAALERERSRIAQDMHDDLGANLTQVAILSEIARKEAADSQPIDQQLERVSAAARSAVTHISELVWATNPRNDTLPNLLAYLREYIAGYIEPTPIQYHLDFPSTVPDRLLTAEFRRNLFLAVKEALHNAIKHSGASRVEVAAVVTGRDLTVSLADNGRGFNATAVPPFHNGLINVHERIRALNGTIELQTRPGEGTRVRINLPLPQSSSD